MRCVIVKEKLTDPTTFLKTKEGTSYEKGKPTDFKGGSNIWSVSSLAVLPRLEGWSPMYFRIGAQC